MSVGTRILSVEDDERIRTAVKLALEDEGWSVEEAGTGEEARVLLARHPLADEARGGGDRGVAIRALVRSDLAKGT